MTKVAQKPCPFCLDVFEVLDVGLEEARIDDELPHYLSAITSWLIVNGIMHSPGENPELFFEGLTKVFKRAGLDVSIHRVQ